MNQSVIDALKEMRFSAMAAEFERQLNDAATYAVLGFEERFSLLVEAERNRRQQNKLIRTIHKAHFALPGAEIEDVEYYEDRRLDKAQILRFATCQYIEDKHHIILKGASGSGKTFLACALGNAACRKFKSVRYIRMPELLEELGLAQAAGELKKALKSYQKVDLLILDEWLAHKLPERDAKWIYELMEMRSGIHPTIFVGQYSSDAWHDRLGSGTLADAIMDRIIHNSYPFTASETNLRKIYDEQKLKKLLDSFDD